VDRHQTLYVGLNKAVEDLSTRLRAMHNPSLTISPAGPAKVSAKPIIFPLIAAMLGLLLGVGIAVLQEHADDRIHTANDVRRSLTAPIMAEVPLIERPKGALVDLRQGGIGVHDSYRVLRANMQFAMESDTTWSVAVSSTMPNEGKTLTAANLGIALAISGYRVVVVDADLRDPSLHKCFGLKDEPGLTDILTDNIGLDEALQPTPVRGLWVLTAGKPTPNAAELLASEAMRSLHYNLKDRAHAVIFDTPPVLAAADAQLVSAETDALLYVVRAGAPTRTAVERAMELVASARANLLGLVVNQVDSEDKGNYYYCGNSGRHKEPKRDRDSGIQLPVETASKESSETGRSPENGAPAAEAVALRRWPPERLSAESSRQNLAARPANSETTTHTVVLAGGTATIEGVSGPYSGKSFPLLGVRTTTIGRNPGLDITLDMDPLVSRNHARIEFEDGGHVVYDEGSSNGTFVNKALVVSQRLKSGDMLRIGKTEFRYELKDESVGSTKELSAGSGQTEMDA
jgi:capsular exopolysaccharide synthesis family protein